MAAVQNPDTMSFWEHLDVLRGILFKIAVVTLVFACIAFVFKEPLFDIILAPKSDDFFIYQFLNSLSSLLSPNGSDGHFEVQLINTGLAKQFIIHMKAALYAGFLVAAPYTLYQLFRFVSPALYTNEKKYAVKVLGGGGIMFFLGVLLSYFVIFPLTFRFLGTYQVDASVVNMISLESYMDTLMMLCIMMGIVFEIPILCWLFAKFGFINADFMKKYRKHAVVILLIISAIITPTADVFTLTVVAFPMWLLYEISIIIVQQTKAAKKAQEEAEAEAERKEDEAYFERRKAEKAKENEMEAEEAASESTEEKDKSDTELKEKSKTEEQQPEDYNKTYNYYGTDNTVNEEKHANATKLKIRAKQRENLQRHKKHKKKR